MQGFLVCKITPSDVTVVLNGNHKSIPREHQDADKVVALSREYNETRDITRREDITKELETILTPGKVIELASDNRFVFDETRQLFLKGTSIPIPEVLAKRILQFIEKKLPIDALVNFWKQLLLNPDERVREQTYGFIEHNDIAITSKGYLVCAKAVQVKRKFDKATGDMIINKVYDEDTGELIKEEYTSDMEFTPYHSGPFGMLVKIGEVISMPREQCNNDPNVTCSAGLHVGSIKYVADFGNSNGVILECLVSPRHIVSIPRDYNNTKMRCCQYYPIALTNGKNTSLYLENDYHEITVQELDKELVKMKTAKAEAIAGIEKSFSEIEFISNSVK